jgi:hypothetical protein
MANSSDIPDSRHYGALVVFFVSRGNAAQIIYTTSSALPKMSSSVNSPTVLRVSPGDDLDKGAFLVQSSQPCPRDQDPGQAISYSEKVKRQDRVKDGVGRDPTR